MLYLNEEIFVDKGKVYNVIRKQIGQSNGTRYALITCSETKQEKAYRNEPYFIYQKVAYPLVTVHRTVLKNILKIKITFERKGKCLHS